MSTKKGGRGRSESDAAAAAAAHTSAAHSSTLSSTTEPTEGGVVQTDDDGKKFDNYKVVLIGEGGVGKSAMTIVFTQDMFITEYDPTIENVYQKNITVDEQICVLDILDTAGQEEFSSMREAYFRQGHGFLLVWSVIDRFSFTAAAESYKKILRVKESESYPIVFCANKADMTATRCVTQAEGEAFAKNSGNCPYYETSAKLRQNIDAVFYQLVREMRKYTSGHTDLVADGESRPEYVSKKQKKKRGKCAFL
ncbi:Ras GTPase [Pelomyxa schiedti]|nr:Ras GTPase [Pelomyxa schiedti]